jgi:hypothetical protein
MVLVALVATGVLGLWLGVRFLTQAQCPTVAVEVRNIGQSELLNVKVCLGKRCEAYDEIGVAESVVARLIPLSESSIAVTYSTNGGERRTDLDLYVEPGWSGTVTVGIDDAKWVVQADGLVPPVSWVTSMCATGVQVP